MARSLPWTSGALLSAARHALREGIACAPVSGFHHACYDSGGGYCTFNGLMVAVAKLLSEGLVHRVLIHDCDQHYGNGTDQIIAQLSMDGVVENATFGRWFCAPPEASAYLKDEVTQRYLRRFTKSEGVLYVGKAQEKARVMRTERRRSRRTGGTYPWIVDSTAMVNHYYFYCVDEDFGPFFLKFCSYFPYNAKLCINGHEYLKRQLAKRGVAFEALDNGIKSCADPNLLRRLSDGLSAGRIDRLLRKWLKRLPHPFPPRDRAAGYRYQLSILQAEFSLTQVLDQPVMGRIFFEEVIRENLDIGRPSQVSLVFDRRVSRCTPGQFRTRVITDGVVPSLHVDYKKTRIKQYHKEGQALRTETTINDTRDFAIGRRIKNLEDLRKIGFAANRRLLDVQRIGHDCFIGEASFQDSPAAANPVLPMARSIRAAETAINKWYEHEKLAA